MKKIFIIFLSLSFPFYFFIFPIFTFSAHGPNYNYELKGLKAGQPPSSDNSWTKGNLCGGGGSCYAEGDDIPSRLEITGLEIGTNYSVVIQHDYQDNRGNLGYDYFHRNNLILPDIGATNVSISYISPEVSCGNDICKNYTLSFTATATEATIYWNSHLSFDAAEWNGSSLHFRLVSGIGGEQVGNKEVPVPVRELLLLPSLTLTKVVEIGDEPPDRWNFLINPAINGETLFDIPDGQSSITIHNVPSGIYQITEIGPPGYVLSGNGPNVNCSFSGGIATANVAAGDPAVNASCVFHNALNIGGVVIHKDVRGPNGEEIIDSDANFTISLDGGNEQNIQDGGTVVYGNVTAGPHTINETAIPFGYTLYSITPDEDNDPSNGAQFNVVPGQTVDIYIVNYQLPANIIVTKDVVPNDSSLWNFEITGTETHQFVLGDNESSGQIFVPAGAYTVTENGYGGTTTAYYTPSFFCENLHTQEIFSGEAYSTPEIRVGPGENLTCLFTNTIKRGRVTVLKFYDQNGNGEQDQEDFTLDDWVINLGGDSRSTSNGQTVFSDLLPGQYLLSEQLQDGWIQTGISCPNANLQQIDYNLYLLSIEPAENVFCKIGNTYPTPVLTIEKENDKAGVVLSPGDTVTYTLYINTTTNPLFNVKVLDIIPFNFRYILSSYTVKSSIFGDITSLISQPDYSSGFGTWLLGNMLPGEEITISYQAKSSEEAVGGEYKDNAWASGFDLFGNKVFGTSGLRGFLTSNFVGTAILIKTDQEVDGSYDVFKGEKIVQKIVEGPEILPKTGSQVFPLALMLPIVAYFLLILIRKKIKKIWLKLVGLVMLFGLFFALPNSAIAANLNIRLESPSPVVSQPVFTLDYVLGDLLARPNINVICLKKGPSDAIFTQFGPTAFYNFGGTGICDLTSSPLTTPGIYQFKVRAEASGPNEVIESDVVSTEFVLTGPGTPTDYSKTLTGCNYKISLKTALDGGRTHRVQIYMSELKSFALNSTTMVFNTLASSGQLINVLIPKPDCSKEYFFAARAFDSAGNPSSPVGDEEIRIVEQTVLVPRVGAGTTVAVTAPPGIPGAAAPAPAGAVLGATAGPGEAEEAAGQNNTESEEGKTLGEEAKRIGNGFPTWGYIALGITTFVIAISLWRFNKKRFRR